VSSRLPSSTITTRSTTSSATTSSYVRRSVRAALYAGMTTTTFWPFSMPSASEVGERRGGVAVARTEPEDLAVVRGRVGRRAAAREHGRVVPVRVDVVG